MNYLLCIYLYNFVILSTVVKNIIDLKFCLMSEAKRIQIKSRKQHIRLWFEFYKICLTQTEFKKNLMQSRHFYKPWGNVLDIKFDDWWNINKDLFGPTRVEEISKISKHPNSLNLVIPLNQKLTTILKNVKTIIETKQVSRLKEIGVDHKTLKSLDKGFGEYELSSKEIKGQSIYQILLIYQVFIKHNKPPINKEFLINIHEFLKERPRSILRSFRSINEDLHKYTPGQLDNEIRVIRRNIKQGYNVLKNVSLGKFP